MAKIHLTVFVLFSLSMLITDAQTIHPQKQEKTAEFRVYVHDIHGGPNRTVHEVARANITSTSPSSFGRVLVTDDLMTVGPSASSQKLGRVQGLVTSTAMDEPSLIISGVFLFNNGAYNGSSISTLGWKLFVGDNQEMPIVGGTGIFRMARGYIVSSIHSQDHTTNTYLLSFDLYIVYLG